MIKTKIDTKYSNSKMLLGTQGEEAAELQWLRQEEPLNVVIHAGGDGLGNTYVTFSKPESFDYASNGDLTARKTKRWSFCYGESNTLDVIPKMIRSTASRDDIHLLRSRCSKVRRPAWMKSNDLRR